MRKKRDTITTRQKEGYSRRHQTQLHSTQLTHARARESVSKRSVCLLGGNQRKIYFLPNHPDRAPLASEAFSSTLDSIFSAPDFSSAVVSWRIWSRRLAWFLASARAESTYIPVETNCQRELQSFSLKYMRRLRSEGKREGREGRGLKRTA